jgi:toxin ParE1/3/4
VTIKPAVLRARAEADIDAIVNHYLAEAGVAVALAFTDALDRAIRHVERSPATGSLRYGDQSGQPGLRFWPIRRFPHLVFYFERTDSVDVVRVLHGSRDVPAALRS